MEDFVKPSGINFSCVDNVSAEALARALCKTASFLQAVDPYVKLRRYEDWWEHDGLHFYRAETDFEQLFGLIHSPQALLLAMTEDDEVFVGVAPVNSDWYLRFYLFWDDDGFNLFGKFDLTIPHHLRPKYKEEVVEGLCFELQETDSDVYYGRLFNGEVEQ